jgi:His-Xaa-Ser system radical SAM maturase HxsC
VVTACRDRLPQTSLHVLSNGRRFIDDSYARSFGHIEHPDVMVGVPVYSDIDREHAFVVQAKGAFEETILGIYNLALYRVPVEIRVVVHRETYARLPQLAEYIYRNLTFASHVAFMGLEITGFARANLRSLWLHPSDYAKELEAAAQLLAAVGMNISIYNHQLCALPRLLWQFSRRSISDWKNEFAPECSGCVVRSDCGGFFAWNLKYSDSRVQPITAATGM